MFLFVFIFCFSFSLFVLFTSLLFIFFGFNFYFDLTFFFVNSVCLNLSFCVDWISVVFFGFVLFIFSFVVLFSFFYFLFDVFSDYLLFLIFLFFILMVFLIFGLDFFVVLFAWDGLGIISFVLVIYYQNMISFKSGLLVIMFNRLGDIMLFLCLIMFFGLGFWDLFYVDLGKYSVLIFFLCLTKSAQFPFYYWLPLAMVAPTPISSLVHSSTLVTVGAYVLIRFNVGLFYFSLFIFTLFVSFVGLLGVYNLKEVLAYSTLNHLSFIMFFLSLGLFNLSFVYLIVHALFKSLMFMCLGYFIVSSGGYQDIRFFGGLIFNFPLVFSLFGFILLVMWGMPFFSMFYLKEVVFETLFIDGLNFFFFFFFFFFFCVKWILCY